MAEGGSATKPEGTFYSIDTEINQSDWLRKLIFKALLFDRLLPRAHILPLRRRGHATLDDQNSNRVTKNSNKWVRIVTHIHTYVRTYVRIVGRLLNIVYCLYV